MRENVVKIVMRAVDCSLSAAVVNGPGVSIIWLLGSVVEETTPVLSDADEISCVCVGYTVRYSAARIN